MRKKISLPPHTSSVQLPHSLLCVRCNLRDTLLKQERKLTAKTRTHTHTQRLQPHRQRQPVCTWSLYLMKWHSWTLEWTGFFFSFREGYLQVVREEVRLEKLVGLHSQHAPAVSEHLEAVWLYSEVSAYLFWNCNTHTHTSRLSHSNLHWIQWLSSVVWIQMIFV